MMFNPNLRRSEVFWPARRRGRFLLLDEELARASEPSKSSVARMRTSHPGEATARVTVRRAGRTSIVFTGEAKRIPSW
jgi:hypothetical protein